MSRAVALALAAVALGVAGLPLHAQSGIDQAVITGGASDVRGRIAVNQTAGASNAQANLAAIALGWRGEATQRVAQQVAGGATPRDASVVIGDRAFVGSAGLLSINQSAGSANAQANLFAAGPSGPLAAAIVTLGDAALADVAGDPGHPGAAAPPALREATIGGGSFGASRGVVQVNQAAGVGNASVNAIVLQLPGGAP